MTAADIRIAKDMINTVSQLALLIPAEHADAVLQAINRHETLQPVVDPTGYREVADNLPGHKREVEAFLEFRRALAEIAGEPQSH
ncbi:MAG: hypothetical protein ACYC5O_00780 [Anaerolineae bacterium]